MESRPRSGAWSGWLLPLGWCLAAGLLYTVNLDRLPHPDELYHALPARALLETGEPRLADGLYTRALLHTWLVAESYRLFGDSLAAARAPSVLCMAALVGLLFAWLRREGGPAVAWTGTALFALSPFTIDIAQLARFYAPQCLSFVLASLLAYEAVGARGDPRRQLVCALLAAPILLLAIYLQPTSLIGMVGLGLWIAGAIGIPWLADPAIGWPRKRLVIGGIGVLGLLLLAALAATGILGELWQRYRWAPLFNRGTADQFWYYHAWYSLLYPTLWPVTGLLALAALAALPRAAGLALTIFATAFLLNSFAAPKNLRYIAYAQPFLYVLWGIGLVHVWPSLCAFARSLTARIGAALGPRRPGTARLARLLVAGAVLFLVLANPVWLRTATLLADITVPPERPRPDWPLVRPVLQPWIERADVVVSTEELGTLYFLGRFDIRLSRSKIDELAQLEQRDFSLDPRTGRPLVGSPEALRRILACYRTGIILGPVDSWGKAHVIGPEIARLIEEHARPLALPPRSRVYAYVWEHAAVPGSPEGCAGLPLFKQAASG